MEENEIISPEIDMAWEIREIAEDFSKPLEVFREAISNAYDAGAKEIKIKVYLAYEGDYKVNPMKIEISDNGKGMTKDQLKAFWSLGFSDKRNKRKSDEMDIDYIGCKGHGTKIYLKSKYIEVYTTNKHNALTAICNDPMSSLKRGELYKVEVKEGKKEFPEGTKIVLEGFVQEHDSNSQYLDKDTIIDYIKWFTKHGSVEREFGINKHKDVKIILDVFDDHEEIKFGHEFAEETDDLNELKVEYQEDAISFFAKKFIKKNFKLTRYPQYKLDMIIAVEGEEAKKKYNSQLRNKKYTSKNRYGVYLCKDYMPIMKVDNWIKSFLDGSNSILKLHGFINCQGFDLTANRGSVSLSSGDVEEALQEELNDYLKEIEDKLRELGYQDLKNEIKMIKTREKEINEYENRIKNIEKKPILKFKDSEVGKLFEPSNETELLMIFSMIYAKYPELFNFYPKDYNANSGIDMIVTPKDYSHARGESKYIYVELKKTFNNQIQFNHSFSKIGYLLCWEIASNLNKDRDFVSEIDGENEKWKLTGDSVKKYLERDGVANRIEIIELKEIVNKLVTDGKIERIEE